VVRGAAQSRGEGALGAALAQKKKKKKKLSACRGEGSVVGLQLRVRFVPAALLAMLRTALALQLLGQVAPAGVPLAVSPAGAGLRRITLYQLSRLWANALAV
jgi:hypothetical protein